MSSETIRDKLKSEVCEADIKDLVRSFAAGNLFEVAVESDLVQVGVILAENNHQKLKCLMASGAVKKLNDETFHTWFAANKIVQILIVSPFVLAQDLAAKDHIQ